jgi:hypothetical protein
VNICQKEEYFIGEEFIQKNEENSDFYDILYEIKYENALTGDKSQKNQSEKKFINEIKDNTVEEKEKIKKDNSLETSKINTPINLNPDTSKDNPQVANGLNPSKEKEDEKINTSSPNILLYNPDTQIQFSESVQTININGEDGTFEYTVQSVLPNQNIIDNFLEFNDLDLPSNNSHFIDNHNDDDSFINFTAIQNIQYNHG